MANFKPNTRYTNGNTTKDRSGRTFLVLRKPLSLQPASDDTFVTIDNSLIDRPDIISYKAYGTRDLWWAIYEFNNIRDPFFDLQLGQILRIPARARLLEAISKLNKV